MSSTFIVTQERCENIREHRDKVCSIFLTTKLYMETMIRNEGYLNVNNITRDTLKAIYDVEDESELHITESEKSLFKLVFNYVYYYMRSKRDEIISIKRTDNNTLTEEEITTGYEYTYENCYHLRDCLRKVEENVYRFVDQRKLFNADKISQGYELSESNIENADDETMLKKSYDEKSRYIDFMLRFDHSKEYVKSNEHIEREFKEFLSSYHERDIKDLEIRENYQYLTIYKMMDKFKEKQEILRIAFKEATTEERKIELDEIRKNFERVLRNLMFVMNILENYSEKLNEIRRESSLNITKVIDLRKLGMGIENSLYINEQRIDNLI